MLYNVCAHKKFYFVLMEIQMMNHWDVPFHECTHWLNFCGGWTNSMACALLFLIDGCWLLFTFMYETIFSTIFSLYCYFLWRIVAHWWRWRRNKWLKADKKCYIVEAHTKTTYNKISPNTFILVWHSHSLSRYGPSLFWKSGLFESHLKLKFNWMFFCMDVI